ncbi:AGAP006822-PA [Anopheles gambiae str. PEST]|nr:AGAP006822-PA [Anopheles gambiae str. PEST]
MPTMSSTWIEERPGDHGGSPVARPHHRDGSEPCSDVFSNISNQSAGSGRSSGVRRFGDIFRNRLKLAGVAAMRTFNESFPQECKIHTDEENGVETPSPKGAQAGAKAVFDRSLDAVLVNERATGRRDRTFTERSNTLAGTGGTAMTGKGAVGAGGGGGGAGAGGLRSRRSSTMFRQRTTVQRTSSG